jgi:hypothetical protein
MSPAGVVLWAKSVGTANDGCNAPEFGASITTDNAGNVYVAGEIVYKVFKNTTICSTVSTASVCANATSKSVTCPYVVKYNSAGTKIWEKKYGNNGALATTSCWYNHPVASCIRTDGTNIYVTGYFYGTVNFGTGNLSTGSEETANVFLLKLDGTGNTTWARSVTGSNNVGYAVGDGLFIDNNNDVYIRGLFYSGMISFGACSLTFASMNGYFAKYTSAGACSWAITPGGIPYGVVNHPNGNLAMLLRTAATVPQQSYDIIELSPADGSILSSTGPLPEDTATGSFGGYLSITETPDGFLFSLRAQGTFHFGELTVTSSQALGSGYVDLMLMKYTALPAERNAPSELASSLAIYPVPASEQLTIQNRDNKSLGTVHIYDVTGKMLYKNYVESSQSTIDVKDFAAGVYYIQSDQVPATLKFVKQ